MTKSLRKGMAAARFEAGYEAAVCFSTVDEAAACSGAGIEDSRWWLWCGRECEVKILLSVVRESAGLKF
jgi:hypothetical protein